MKPGRKPETLKDMAELFSVAVREHLSIPILVLEGELTAEGEADLVQAFQSVESRGSRLVFDFTKVQYINSGGISALLNLISHSRSADRQIFFCGLSRHLGKVIEIVGMGEFVTVRPTVDDAVR